jgi:hypothetical protein
VPAVVLEKYHYLQGREGLLTVSEGDIRQSSGEFKHHA